MNTTLSSQIFVVFSFIDGFQLVLGSLCNILVMITCSRENLFNNFSFILIKFISIANLTNLLGGSSVRFFNQILELHMEYNNWTFCKVNTAISLFTFQWISWSISLIPLQIHFSIKYGNFYKKHLSPKLLHLICLSIGAILLIANFTLVFVDDFRFESSNSLNTTIIPDLVLQCLAPFSFTNYIKYILIVNIQPYIL